MTSSVNKPKRQKLNYINVFRALAILLIVAGHAVQTKHPVLKPIFNTFLQDGTVLFVFISGFLFQYLSDSFSYKTYLKKKFFNIICPYLFTSVAGIALLFTVPRLNPLAALNKIVQIPLFLTTGIFHNLPTWYIPMTCVFFLWVPVLVKMTQQKFSNGKSLLFYILAFLVLVPLCVPRLELPVDVGTPWGSYVAALQANIFRTGLFFPVYMLGMFTACQRDKISKLYAHRGLLWVLFAVACVLDFWVIYHKLLPGRLLAPKMILTFLVLGYLEHYDNALMSKPRLNAWLDTVATYSFSIFFLHYYLVLAQSFTLKHILHLPVDISVLNGANFMYWLGTGLFQFAVAFVGSLVLAATAKKLLTKWGVKNTRWFIGV